MPMTCPKCQADMRQYERNGVVVDQCGDCRGIFLDRGELERLIDAENSWYGQQPSQARPAPQYQQPQYQQPQYQQPQYQQPQYQQPQYEHQHGGHKKRKSFLDD